MRCDLRESWTFVVRYEFQSTHLHEVRREETRAKRYINDMFQSTHLHEVRRQYSKTCGFAEQSFNPRTYMRCDGELDLTDTDFGVSIHAPT